MPNRVFDRLVSYDERSLNYPVRTLFTVGQVPRSYTWRHVQLDQGESGACTGFSATMEAAARPVPVFGDPRMYPPGTDVSYINNFAFKIYNRAQQLDEWPGEDYEGSSILGAVKAGAEVGWWKEYRWALGPGSAAAAQDVILALGYHGPVIIGSYWYEDMMDPDRNGYLHATGEILGGHAWLLTSYSIKKDAVWTPNSWGGFGQGWITRNDLIKLLEYEGEACIPVIRTKPKTNVNPNIQ